jgi:DNA-binding MarR family transcriptional regulator
VSQNPKNLKTPLPKPDQAQTAELLEYFYPVHYQLGTALEDVVRARTLSRQQAAILWLIRSAGGPEFRMPRKEIELKIRNWFEVTGAAVSKSLRGMARRPLELIHISEDPSSGRENLVTLTPKGLQFLDRTTARAREFLSQLIEDVPANLVAEAMEFFAHVTRAFQHSSMRDRLRLVDSKSGGSEARKAR